MEAFQEYDEAYGPHTIRDIEALPEGQKAELIDGYIYMMGTPNTVHQRLSGEIHAEIRNYIKGKKGSCRAYTAPCAVYLDEKKTEKHWVEPDIFVVCSADRIHEDGIYGPPDWVIEIVSPSSIATDFIKKVNLYEYYGVKEYWIVNPMKGIVTTFLYSPKLQTSQYTFDDEISPVLFPELILKISELL